MDENSIIQYITQTFDKIQIATSNGNHFFYYGPEDKIPERTMPFATLVTNDDYDQISLLNRPGIFRLNIGVSKTTYHSLLGPQPFPPGASGIVDTGHDFTALDQLMPHPIYGHLFWTCVLNPSDKTFQTIKPLLAEAYNAAVSKKRNMHKLNL